MLYAVIPAGGSGTRLWPLSRADHPKFLLPLMGGDSSLLQHTVARLAPLTGPGRTFVVTGAGHAAAVARQLPEVPTDNILVEPGPLDSCPAIGLAAAVIAQRDPQAVMGSFAADHVVRDQARFAAAVQEAMAGAEQGWLMTIGMKPTRPETGFGYVQCDGDGDGTGDGAIRRVRRFKEKPDHDLAVTFVNSGDYLWNASVFIWRVDVFLAELGRQQPRLYEGLTRIAAAWDTPERAAVMGEVWPHLDRIAIEYAVMEGAAAEGKVATVPGDFGWSDVGDFRNLGDLLPADNDGNVALVDREVDSEPQRDHNPVLMHDTTGTTVVANSGRLVTTLGLHDVVIVDTPDVLLVCSRDRAQDVKRLAETVRQWDGPA